MMTKKLRPLLLLFLMLLLASAGFSQRKFGGKVIDVLDGKTVVIDMESGRLTAVMQYIEVPEREQPLYSTVREHLAKLVLGKTVEFDPQGILPAKTFGQLYVGGLDIAQQMLRDGAAWHMSMDISGQNVTESALYHQVQEEAKGEKRGVWGVKDLKPAWEFRAAKEEAARQREFAAAEAGTTTAAGSKNAPDGAVSRRPGMWPDTNPALKNIGALLNGYNAKTRNGYLGTSLMGVTEIEKEKEDAQQKTAVDITYFYNEGEKGRTGVYVITLLSSAKDWRFLKLNDLVLVNDDKNTVIAKAKRTTSLEGDMRQEKLTYQISRASLEKIVNGDDVVIKAGGYLMRPSHGLKLLLYNMLQVSE